MKKILLAAAILFVTIGISHAQQSSDFRGFSWGSSINKVQSDEKAEFVFKVNDNELKYNEKLAGQDVDAYYIFNDNDKLISGLYFFTKKYDNNQLYLQDYNKFKSLLTEKYGKPKAEKENWVIKTKSKDKNSYGQAIADGNLALNTTWITGNTTIKIKLVGTDKNPSLQIAYTTNTLNEMENKEAMKTALSKL
jgi:hypothetical protein